jgi:osmotically-inducible protein OsmY
MGYPQLRSVDCQSEGDSILLSGKIESFYMKQMAQEVATKTPGVRAVRNEIQVV